METKHRSYKRATISLSLLVIWLFGLGLPVTAAAPVTRTTAAPLAAPNQLPAACNTGITSDVAADTTWSGDIYIADNISIDSSATLTITPGTNVFFCGEYRLKVGTLFNPGRLIARGTPNQPITFQAADETVTWRELFFEDRIDGAGPSILQFAEFSGGGGSDPASGQTLLISNRATFPDYHTPIVDHVTIHDSGGYGINLNVDAENDPTPPQLTHVTIENTTLAPILTDPAGVGSLGAGIALDHNTTNRILVRGGQVGFDQQWRDHGVPYEIQDDVYARAAYPDGDVRPAVWALDPGVELLIHPDVNLTIGSLYGQGSLQAMGTEAQPITLTRLSDVSAPWGALRFDGWNKADSELHHVALLYGGGPAGASTQSVIYKGDQGKLLLDDVTIQKSFNGAIYGSDGALAIRDSTLTFNRFGINFYGPEAQVRSSNLSNNAEYAFTNGSPTSYCYDAIGNVWGPGGPSDASATLDACGNTGTNTGTGQVSDGIRYTPWLSGSGGLTSFGLIQPDVHWVIANGVDSAALTVKLWDGQGNPLAGKTVTLESNLGVIAQPAGPTNTDGEVTAVIISTETGFATLTAYNVTDDEPVAGIGGVTFWQGGGDFGGLVTPDGAPYASPSLIVQGQPFQQGFPVDMRVPMRNSKPTPIDVEVVYGVSGLGLGVRFTPVYTTSETLQPGESWDARGIWLPTVTGHHCIQATVTTGGVSRLAVNSTGTTGKNTDPNPCTDLPSDPGDFFPGPPSFNGAKDAEKVAKHYGKQGNNLRKANNCIANQLNYQRLALTAGTRDYETIVTLPVFTPPPIQADADVTQAQADALNALSQTSADILALNLATGVTRQRMNWAAQAGELNDLDRQYAAFLGFMSQYVQKLRTLASQHDDLLAATEGAGMNNGIYYPEDYEAAYAELEQQGFDTETETYLLGSGLDADLIEEIRQDILAEGVGRTFTTTSFYDILRQTRDEALALADRYEAQYDGLQARQSLAAAPATLQPEVQTYQFRVGHTLPTTETVELVIKPVSLPIDWSTGLSDQSLSLAPGEVTTATLTLTPGEAVPEQSTIQVAVEGYVDGALIGGVLFSYNVPAVTTVRFTNHIFLPTVLRQ